MPKRVAPASFVAGVALNLGGTVYAAGAAVPNAVVASVRNLSALLSTRRLIPNTDLRGRPTANMKRTARDLSPAERRSLLS